MPLPHAALLALSLTAPRNRVRQAPARQTQALVIVMLDGLRWQEVFRGADPTLLASLGVHDPRAPLYNQATVEERRRALMPFLWDVMARSGQLLGNQDRGSMVHLHNQMNFSYPGYAETLCGHADPAIQGNDDKPNPDPSVLEWLESRPGFGGQVAAFATWHTFHWILREGSSGLLVNAGREPLQVPNPTMRTQLLNHLKAEGFPRSVSEPSDAVTFWQAHTYLTTRKPRVLFLQLGETDGTAHAGNYGAYLDAIHRADQWLGELWDTLQSMPEYQGRTALLACPDHGRGARAETWKDHGPDRPSSHYTWIAALGPDIPALGEQGRATPVENAQVAATAAALLGEDFTRSDPRVEPPIPCLLPEGVRGGPR